MRNWRRLNAGLEDLIVAVIIVLLGYIIFKAGEVYTPTEGAFPPPTEERR